MICKKKAIDRNKEKQMLQSMLNNTERELQLKGSNSQLEEKANGVKCQLRNIQQYKIKGQKTRARMNWMKGGDKGTKYFFNIIRAKHKRELIKGIQISGELSNEPSSIKEAFFSFYKDLFTS